MMEIILEELEEVQQKTESPAIQKIKGLTTAAMFAIVAIVYGWEKGSIMQVEQSMPPATTDDITELRKREDFIIQRAKRNRNKFLDDLLSQMPKITRQKD